MLLLGKKFTAKGQLLAMLLYRSTLLESLTLYAITEALQVNLVNAVFPDVASLEAILLSLTV